MTKENEAPKAPQKSSVRSYFTKEVNDRIAAMPVAQMESIMKGIMDSEEWIAILKYTSMRMPLLDSQLRSINPVLDPHKISWTQGAMAGLCDIEGYVIELNENAKEKAKQKSEDEELPPNHPHVGGM